MAYQMRAISNNPLLRRNQTAELNARMQYLPNMIAAKNRKADISRQESMNKAQKAQWDRNYNLQRKQNKFATKQSKMGMGLEMGKLGLNIMSNYGSNKLNPSRGSLGSLFGGSTGFGKSGGGAGGLVSKLNLGNMIGGGLAGYGVSQMVGGSKGKKAGLGALAGGALGFLGGGGLSGAISGGLGGGLGGLFG